MGYFRRKLDRGRAARDAERLQEQAVKPREWPIWSGPDPTSPPAFLRFAVPPRHGESGRAVGIFHATNLLEDLDPHVNERLEEVMDWFSSHLRVPRIDEPGAVFYFKSECEAVIRRIWDLAWILNEEGLHVHVLRVTDPGRVVYEDDEQLAAIPWRSTPDL